jgi:hypothetical protein
MIDRAQRVVGAAPAAIRRDAIDQAERACVASFRRALFFGSHSFDFVGSGIPSAVMT